MPITFSDPIHGRVRLEDSMRKIVESRALTRLRNVRQLGLTSVSYPGAVHTRFEHTIGTAAVMQSLLDQFGVEDRDERDRCMVAALLSEIGTFPLSISTDAIFRKAGITKAECARQVYERFLEYDLQLSPEDCKFVFEADKQRDGWFRRMPGLDRFPSLTPVSLASRIDYVLRDGHYSGRYQHVFDYRYFRSLDPRGGYEAAKEMTESVYELHRAIHALNAVYGDPLRRFLTQVLVRLVFRLMAKQLLQIEELTPPERFIDLDDDQFLFHVAMAVENSAARGDNLARRMFDTISRSVQSGIAVRQMSEEERNLEADEIEARIAEEVGVEAEAVFVLSEPHNTAVGFRLFGRDYGSYQEAVASRDFAELTGLLEASDKPGLQQWDGIRYLVV